MSTPCEDGNAIAQVGTISANSDEAVGGIIAEAMDKVGKEREFEPHGIKLDSYENVLEAVKKYVKRALELLVKQGIRQSDALGERQARAIRQRLARHGEQKDALFRLLNNFSYERVLERGFVLVRDNRARPLTSAAALKPGMELALRFHDGEAAAVAAGRPKGGKERGSGGEDGEQGSLL